MEEQFAISGTDNLKVNNLKNGCETRILTLNFFSFKFAGFAETSFWPTTYSTVALTCHGRNVSSRQRSETFEDMTSSYATAEFAYSDGKQPSLSDFPSRGKNS